MTRVIRRTLFYQLSQPDKSAVPETKTVYGLIWVHDFTAYHDRWIQVVRHMKSINNFEFINLSLNFILPYPGCY